MNIRMATLLAAALALPAPLTAALPATDTTLTLPVADTSFVTPLADAFDAAATAYDVPRDLLVAVAYAETRLDGHRGEPSASGGYGMMHLAGPALDQAAALTSRPVEEVRKDDAANVAGGAAVLRAHADALGLDPAARKDPARWYGAVARYGNASSDAVARLYADAVYEALSAGISAVTPGGERVRVAARAVRPERGKYDGQRFAAAAVDYPGARWVAANPANYAVSNRPSGDAITKIVIHVAQGSYAGTISWFQDPAAKSSAHYVVRSADGDVTQMVREKDRAWHAGNSTYNRASVGIEHEGFVDNATWFTETMYRSSAALTRNIADRYGIPKDRAHIIGHVEVPGADHTDPGRFWDWAKYMSYINGANPHTPESVCGAGHKVIDSAPLGSAGNVYLLYNATTGENCVATVKTSSLGTATATSAYLEVEGRDRETDAGSYAYYAGPVKAVAPGACVRWGGKAGASSYDSPLEHCG